MQAWLILRASPLVRIGGSLGIWRASLTPRERAIRRWEKIYGLQWGPLRARAHYSQSLTLNKHTEVLKGEIEIERGQKKKNFDGCLRAREKEELCESLSHLSSSVVAHPSEPERYGSQAGRASDGTREVSTQFIWRRPGWVPGVLKTRLLSSRSVLPTQRPSPNEISKEDQSQMRRGEDERIGGGEASELSGRFCHGATSPSLDTRIQAYVNSALRRAAVRLRLWVGRRKNVKALRIRDPFFHTLITRRHYLPRVPLVCKYLAEGKCALGDRSHEHFPRYIRTSSLETGVL